MSDDGLLKRQVGTLFSEPEDVQQLERALMADATVLLGEKRDTIARQAREIAELTDELETAHAEIARLRGKRSR